LDIADQERGLSPVVDGDVQVEDLVVGCHGDRLGIDLGANRLGCLIGTEAGDKECEGECEEQEALGWHGVLILC